MPARRADVPGCPASPPGWYATGRTPLRYGSARPTMVPCEAFAAADGHIMAAAGNDGLGRAFADAAGLGLLVMDPRYTTSPGHVRNRTA